MSGESIEPGCSLLAALSSQMVRNRRGTYLRNLGRILVLPHTHFTYHRTWETGLRVAIRVTAFSPAFFSVLPAIPSLE